MIGIMTAEEIDAILRRGRVGRIGCSANDRPYVVPINYVYDGSHVYGYSAPGRKIRTMREQPLVCFEVEEIEGPTTWRSVVAEGVYEEVTRDGERCRALAQLTGREGGIVPRGPLAGDRIVVFRLRLIEKSGRFERRHA